MAADSMGLFRRTRASKNAAAVAETTTAAPTPVPSAPGNEPPTEWLDGHDSDVFVCKRDEPTPAPQPAVDPAVTLFVSGWYNVEPGELSWPFPSMRAALDAVRKMRNAIEWSIALGDGYESLEDARARGMIVIEQKS